MYWHSSIRLRPSTPREHLHDFEPRMKLLVDLFHSVSLVKEIYKNKHNHYKINKCYYMTKIIFIIFKCFKASYNMSNHFSNFEISSPALLSCAVTTRPSPTTSSASSNPQRCSCSLQVDHTCLHIKNLCNYHCKSLKSSLSPKFRLV